MSKPKRLITVVLIVLVNLFLLLYDRRNGK